MSGPGVCVCSGGCLLPGGVCSWGCLLRGVSGPGVFAPGRSAPGGCLVSGVSGLGGVCSQGGCGIPACTEADTPPDDRITDACKTLPWPNFVAAGKNQMKLCYKIYNL